MEPFADERLSGFCIFCCGPAETRDHVPSRIFLDAPTDEMLPVVEACSECNRGFSKDEEYVACFIEAAIQGTASPEKQRREKIRKALAHSPKLVSKIAESSYTDEAGILLWTPDLERVHRVIVKLSRGHAAYELSLPQFNDPTSVVAIPAASLSKDQLKDFECAPNLPESAPFPELGSRAFLRAFGEQPYHKQNGPWIEVQPGRYRYAVTENDLGGIDVRIVIADYLLCHVVWKGEDAS